ncbi:hypothetical protein BDN71DRAFT_1459155 [Pleurotus eryngii]|uniref:Uncharacterized protein n=1 Tax=Pleurotus eryngii TaxID=5323 RepID=A0A9P6D7M1_PLEER|nr:hypothetical protein BDN71DRAFT_1459155 [Pleurotus eryngii]
MIVISDYVYWTSSTLPVLGFSPALITKDASPYPFYNYLPVFVTPTTLLRLPQ